MPVARTLLLSDRQMLNSKAVGPGEKLEARAAGREIR